MSFRRLRRIIFALILGAVIIPLSLNATTWPRFLIEELFRQSDIVAFVEVTEAKTMGLGEDSCGAKYVGYVIEPLKGTTKNTYIEFGPYIHHKIGSRYLIFLTHPDSLFEPVATTNSDHVDKYQEYLRRCKDHKYGYKISHSGIAILEIDWVPEFDYKDGIRVPTRWIGVPADIETVEAAPTDKERFSKLKWIKKAALLEYLKKLSKEDK